MEYSNILEYSPELLGEEHESVSFEPTAYTKTLMLKTKKVSKNYSNIETPGIFNVDEAAYNKDGLMVGVIFILELVGIIALFYSSGSGYFVPKLIVAALLLIADFIIAYQNRSKDNELCVARNRIRIATFFQRLPKNQKHIQAEADNEKVISKIKNRSQLFLYILLIISALKIVIFLYDIKGGNGFSGITGWFMKEHAFLYATPAIYVVIAILHWKFFGHWYNTFLFEESIKKEHAFYERGIETYKQKLAKYQKGNGYHPSVDIIPNRRKGHEHDITIDSDDQKAFKIDALNPVVAERDNPHALEKISNDNDIQYRIRSLGIMVDNDLLYLVSKQQGTNQGIQGDYLGIEGIIHQLDGISTNDPLSSSKI